MNWKNISLETSLHLLSSSVAAALQRKTSSLWQIFIAEILELVWRCVKKGLMFNVEQWSIIIFYRIGQKLQ
jgi:hypothetical protein